MSAVNVRDLLLLLLLLLLFYFIFSISIEAKRHSSDQRGKKTRQGKGQKNMISVMRQDPNPKNDVRGGSRGVSHSRTEEFAPVDVEFVAVYDDGTRSTGLPHHTADLGFAQTIRAHSFDCRRRRRRRRAEKTRCLDPIENPALRRNEDSIKRTILCQ